jgi:hypothetical protein
LEKPGYFMAAIKIVFEGMDAEVAADALVNLPEVTGTWSRPEEPQRNALTTIAAVIGITSGTLSIATNLKKWYDDYQGAEATKIENVVMITPSRSRRLLVDEDTTREEILEFLQQAAAEDEV